MKSITLLKFFEVSPKTYFYFLNVIDLLYITLSTAVSLYYIRVASLNMFITTILYINFIMGISTVSALGYFFFTNKFQFFIHTSYNWMRFMFYFSNVVLLTLIFSHNFHLIFTDLYKEDVDLFYVILFASVFFLLPFCLLNIYWCFHLNKIIYKNADEEDSKMTESESLSNI